jgi:hypothetical protein
MDNGTIQMNTICVEEGIEEGNKRRHKNKMDT